MAKSGRNRRDHPAFGKMVDLMMEMGITDTVELFETLRDMFAGTMEQMLQEELNGHLGYDRYSHEAKSTNNRRNGSSSKRVLSQTGEYELKVPRDREGSFEPQLIRRGEKDISEIEGKIMSMYAKGMSDRDISATVEDIYGFSC